MAFTPEQREEALQVLGEKWGAEISNTFRDLYASIETLHEHEYRLLQALRHIMSLTSGLDPPLIRLAMIEQTVLQALHDDLAPD